MSIIRIQKLSWTGGQRYFVRTRCTISVIVLAVEAILDDCARCLARLMRCEGYGNSLSTIPGMVMPSPVPSDQPYDILCARDFAAPSFFKRLPTDYLPFVVTFLSTIAAQVPSRGLLSSYCFVIVANEIPRRRRNPRRKVDVLESPLPNAVCSVRRNLPGWRACVCWHNGGACFALLRCPPAWNLVMALERSRLDNEWSSELIVE